MSDLLDKRIKFTKLLAKLILWIDEQGYDVTIGQDGLKHMSGSLHYVGLAEDLLLYKNGVWLQKTEDYKFAGDYWKSLDNECCWGGDFQIQDGDHFSIAYSGKK